MSQCFERTLDIEFLQIVLNAKNNDLDIYDSSFDVTRKASPFEHLKFWKILGVNEKSHEPSRMPKIEDFLKLPRVRLT